MFDTGAQPAMQAHTPSAPRTGPLRLAVVDDHAIIRGVFATLAEDDAELVMAWTASTLSEAWMKIQRETPDFLVMDVNLPDGLGFDFVAEVLQALPDLPVLMISASEDTSFQKRAAECGARGYLAKVTSIEKLVEAMHAIQHGGRWFLGAE